MAARYSDSVLHPSELLHWLQVRSNRPAQDAAESAFWSLYAERGQPLSGAPELLTSTRAELMVVVNTYRRPEACHRVLSQLRAALDVEPRSFVLLVLNDHSDRDYGATRAHAEQLFGARVCWLDARARLGKPGFWRAYQVAFFAARALQPAHALFVQDDCELPPTLLTQTYAWWRRTEQDARRRVLYLFSAPDDERLGRWIVYPRRSVAPGLRKTQWFDLQAFFVDRAFFELLRYRLVPVHPNRWRRRPKISSGVGWQLTVRLRLRANIYQTSPALVVHGALPSEMNAEARALRPLDNRG